MNERETLVCTGDLCEVQGVLGHRSSVPPSRVLHIEMVSDWVCPYCPIGEAHLQEALKGFPDLQVTLEYSPYMLNPDLPEEGVERDTLLLQKLGDLAVVRENERKYTALAARVGWTYRYDRMKRSPNTLNAHRLSVHALTQGKQLEVGQALFQAHFTEGRDLSDLEVLLDIGEAAGLDRENLRCYLQSGEDREEVRSRALAQKPIRGIRGAPSFFFNGVLLVTGAERVEVFRERIAASLEVPLG